MVFSRSGSAFQNNIKVLVKYKKVSWKKHALKRMLERRLSRKEVFEALNNCIIVESHELKRPLQTYLVLGFSNKEPIHIMLAIDKKDDILWIITAYVPSIREWHSDFKIRRTK